MVLGGGGARGAYEAGALTILTPELARGGERATIFVGTSVGAINAVSVAAMRHLDPEEAAERGVARWRDAVKPKVLRPILRYQLPRLALRYGALLLGSRRVRVPALLDPAPLGRNLRRWVDWSALGENIRAGRVGSVAVVATAASSGRSVAFVEGRLPAGDRPSRALQYSEATLATEHLLASAAIPILFPAVHVDRPAPIAGWYFDGVARLRHPLKPALDLGADRLVIVGAAPLHEGPTPTAEASRTPDIASGVVTVWNALLEDNLVADVRTLGVVNEFYARGRPGTEAPARYRRARGKQPFRAIPYVFIAPERRGEIAEVAGDVLRANYRGRRALRSPDYAFLSRALGGDSPRANELLSYLLFDRDFIDELIEMGRRDARRWLGTHGDGGGPWRTERIAM